MQTNISKIIFGLTKLRLLTVILTIATAMSGYAHEENIGYATYSDGINYMGGHDYEPNDRMTFVDAEKISIISSRMGKFIVTYDDNYFMTTGVVHCLYQAVNTWESKIVALNPIRFHIRLSEDMNREVSAETKVAYINEGSTAVPYNLSRQQQGQTDCNDTITINALVDWNSSWLYDDTQQGSVDMTNTFMRSIAHVLGCKNCVGTNKETLDVLEEIGWNVKPHDIEVKCRQLNGTGYGSAYQDLTFYAEDEQHNRKNATWTYQAYNPELEEYTDILPASTGNTYSINPSILDYALDDFNCMSARVKCCIDGTEYFYPISLEVRPAIHNVRAYNYTSDGERFYYFDIDVDVSGASSGYIIVSDDTGTTGQYGYTGGTVHAGPFVQGYRTYIDVVMQNQYGDAGFFTSNSPYTQQSAISSNASDIEISANGVSGVDTVKDGDVITVALQDKQLYIDSDSVQWTLCMDGYRGIKVYRDISSDKECSFTIEPRLFRLYFALTDEDRRGDIYGISYNYGGCDVVFPDSCRFICTLFTFDGQKMHEQQSFTSEPFRFDVMPEPPVISLSNIVYNEDYHDYSVDVEVYTYGYDYAEVRMFDFTPPHKNEYFDYLIEKTPYVKYSSYIYETDKTCCMAYNNYGMAKSNTVNAGTFTSISDLHDEGCTIWADGNTINVKSESNSNITIADYAGRIVDQKKQVHSYSESLPAGLYIVKVQTQTGKTLSRKIAVRR